MNPVNPPLPPSTPSSQGPLASAHACICCDGRAWSEVYPGIIACGSCGYQRISQMLSLEDLEKIYSTEFFQGDKYHDYAADKHIIQANFETRLKAVRRWLSRTGVVGGRASLLEVGCAYGFFLELASREFESVRGIDIAVEATAHARDVLHLPVDTGDVLDQDLPLGSFDVVCMWDTIEHLNSPEAYLERVFALLKPGGLFFATTGDVGSLMARIQKRKWRLYDPPVHVHYFSRPSLSRLLERQGFEPMGTESCSFLHSVEQVVHGLGIYSNRQPGLLGSMCRWIYPRLPQRLGGLRFSIQLGDIFMVVARKPLAAEQPPRQRLGLAPKMLAFEDMAGSFDSVMNMYDTTKRVRIIYDELLGDHDLRGQTLLDAGCGTGWFSRRACERGAVVTSLDVGESLLAATREKCTSETVLGDIMHMPFADGQFDYVVSSEVIEHVTHPDLAIQEMFRVVRPGGTVVITTPNKIWHFAIDIANWLGVRPYHGLENWLGYRQLSSLMRQVGFEIEVQRGFHIVPFVSRLLYPLIDFFDRFGSSLGPVMLNTAVRARKPGP